MHKQTMCQKPGSPESSSSTTTKMDCQKYHQASGSADPQMKIVSPAMPSAVAQRKTHTTTHITSLNKVSHEEPELTDVREPTVRLRSIMDLLCIKTLVMGKIKEMEIDGDRTSHFSIESELLCGRSVEVFRRYNDFRALKKNLESRGIVVEAKFPRKHLMGCTGTKLIDRKQRLFSWLHTAVWSPATRETRKPQMLIAKFLGLSSPDTNSRDESSPLSSTSASALPGDVGLGQELNIVVPPGVTAGEVMSIEVPLTVLDAYKTLTVEVPEGIGSFSIWRMWYDHVAGDLVRLPAAAKNRFGMDSDESGMLLAIHIPPGVAVGDMILVTVPDGRQIAIRKPSGVVAGEELDMWFDHKAGSLTILSRP